MAANSFTRRRNSPTVAALNTELSLGRSRKRTISSVCRGTKEPSKSFPIAGGTRCSPGSTRVSKTSAFHGAPRGHAVGAFRCRTIQTKLSTSGSMRSATTSPRWATVPMATTSGDFGSRLRRGTRHREGITRFHAVYWPAILSAGHPLPTRILVHGDVTVDGKKIGKSAGIARQRDSAQKGTHFCR